MTLQWHPPTVETKFHIDTDWWRQNNRDIRVYLKEILCDQCHADYGEQQGQEEIDWIDGQTGAVVRVDALWHCLRTCCGLKPDYISPTTPIIDAVFRTFIANGNKPLSINELYELLDRRPPAALLRILTKGPTYMGIRPVL